ncbi:MAG: nitrile hydratase [Deltaproteobacteria bacterium]|nr:nitrile hydratase [Deltaproteobacteria bacterium]
MANQSLERALVERAWRDPEFRSLMETDPKAALKTLGVEIPDTVKVNIRMQRRDTLYFVIPPSAEHAEDADTVINQMDLWQSADLFCWIMPQALKLELLAMRQDYRKAHP